MNENESLRIKNQYDIMSKVLKFRQYANHKKTQKIADEKLTKSKDIQRQCQKLVEKFKSRQFSNDEYSKDFSAIINSRKKLKIQLESMKKRLLAEKQRNILIGKHSEDFYATFLDHGQLQSLTMLEDHLHAKLKEFDVLNEDVKKFQNTATKFMITEALHQIYLDEISVLKRKVEEETQRFLMSNKCDENQENQPLNEFESKNTERKIALQMLNRKMKNTLT